MSFNAVFYTFSKRENSTAQPSGSGTTLSVELKDNSSVVEPILRLHNTANWNPSDLNYCYINKFARYYWVVDWEYALGEWNCYLKSDPLASFKSGIGGLSKYVLRSYTVNNKDAIDNFYPTLGTVNSAVIDIDDFHFARSYINGSYVIGLVNRAGSGSGSIKYYVLGEQDIRNLLAYMLPYPTEHWTDSFNGLTDTIYRSIYDPFSYIKSCRWFPFNLSNSAGTRETLKFGNYSAETYVNGAWTAYAEGAPLYSSCEYWDVFTGHLVLPPTWPDLEAKFRTNPACHLYILFNPFGVIEINPADLNEFESGYACDIDLELLPDLMTGEGLLKIYKHTYSGTKTLIKQLNSKISIDMPLTASSFDATGLFSNALQSVASIAAAAVSKNPASALTEASFASGAAMNAVNAAAPTISGSNGAQMDGMVALEGKAYLIQTLFDFAAENPSEHGYITLGTYTLNNLSGYIKCADPDCDAVGNMYIDERREISNHLIEGFFYE